MDQPLATKSVFRSVNDVLPILGGFGRFQHILMAIFSAMIFPSTFSTLIMYFAALKPTWRCAANSTICTIKNETFGNDNRFKCNMDRSDWEFVEPKSFSIQTQFDIYCDEEWLVQLSSSILFVGWGIGAVVLGWISDNYGRKLVVFPSNFVIMAVGFLVAFSPNITFLIVCRFIVGFFTPGCGVQSVILLSEYVNSRYRPHVVAVVWLFFSVALCILPLKAYYAMNWKTLVIVCTIPYIFTLAFYKFVPESARWLHLHSDRMQPIKDIFDRIAYWNKEKLPEDFTLLPIEKKQGDKHKSTPMDLFRTRKMVVSIFVQGFTWLVNGMVYYGLSLAADDLGGSLYINFTLLSLIEFPGNLLSVVLCDKIGRRKSTSIVMALGGIACIIVAFIPSTGAIKIFRIVLAMFGKLCITISFSNVYIWSIEILSTDIRAEGMGFLQITSRIGAASSPWIAKSLKSLHPYAPFIVMGSLSVIAAFACLVLPETKGKAMKDVVEEDETSEEGLLRDVNT